ncbi:hypothetical protein ACTXT7_007004 [Hymenolepis weldensis]
MFSALISPNELYNATKADQRDVVRAEKCARATDRVLSMRGRGCRGLQSNERSIFTQRSVNCAQLLRLLQEISSRDTSCVLVTLYVA